MNVDKHEAAAGEARAALTRNGRDRGVTLCSHLFVVEPDAIAVPRWRKVVELAGRHVLAHDCVQNRIRVDKPFRTGADPGDQVVSATMRRRGPGEGF